jgi:hypothetical protein
LKIVVGAREQGTGNREQEEGLGDFTFRYIFRFFSVHLSRWALKIVVGAREQGTGNGEQEESFE